MIDDTPTYSDAPAGTITLARLRELLAEYDEEHGNWPEHMYEGVAVWRWLLEQLAKEAA